LQILTPCVTLAAAVKKFKKNLIFFNYVHGHIVVLLILQGPVSSFPPSIVHYYNLPFFGIERIVLLDFIHRYTPSSESYRNYFFWCHFSSML